jgi:cyclic pyranopterin phosphate synthase
MITTGKRNFMAYLPPKSADYSAECHNDGDMEKSTVIPPDRLQRPLQELRLSVTDRCNFRCTYCMPREVFGPDHPFLPRAQILSFEEMTRITRLLAENGVKKVRLTGGEPLLRHDLEKLVAMLTDIPGLEITLTTNGVLLPKKATALHQAGLHRLNISLDALDDESFQRMSDTQYRVADVLTGIEAAQKAGFGRVKVNAVIRRGVNEHAILPLAEYARAQGITLRFIEFMDVGNHNQWQLDEVVAAREIAELIQARWPSTPLPAHNPSEVSRRYRYQDGAGEWGIIASVTEPFCRGCNRLRLSTDGHLYTCLFASTGHDLKSLLRANKTDDELMAFVAGLWQGRDDRYSEIRSHSTSTAPKVEMSFIGG